MRGRKKRIVSQKNADRPSIDEQIDILKEGLPKPAAPKRILILGAGMAGLVAAYLLKQAGHTVVIIEGNNRVGGRIYTIRDRFTKGNYFDAGAMRIPNYHLLTLELAQKFGLSLNPFISSTDNDLIYVNGQLVRRYQYENNPSLLRYPLAGYEIGKTEIELLESALQPFIDLYENASIEEQERLVEQFDRYSMGTFLRENPLGRPLSAEAIHMIQVLLGIEGFPEGSFIDTYLNIISTIFEEDVEFLEIEGGNDQLPKSFLSLLDEDIYLDQTVERIIQYPDHVDVVTKSGDGKEYEFSGDMVITTIPFTAFQFIEVEPRDSLSYLKWKVIQTLHYVPSVKIGLEFKEKFWEKDGMRGGNLTTDLPIQFLYYPSHDIGKPGPGVLHASYSWGDNARLWESRTEEERIRQTLNYLSAIHGEEVLDLYLGGATFSWDHNPFSAGCFAMYVPYQAANYPEIIKRPEGLMHFAGEHTSELHGWIEGAVESGIRAALEVNERVL
ncbi:flavin monoamine oxidase family protein [Alteribacter populi]|uniref:flavin monoamine oxidase family protein n=1 Tax=Alteribacter populi TaxID=2011011 RepID=UPI000BBA4F8A|nr:flavin monoamine oxidase family protein [Alteribacter populi]